MVHSKERRSWVYVLCVPLVLLCTVSLNPNGATQVETLARTYPSRYARSLSELSLFLNDFISRKNQHTNGNHHTSGNGHNGMNQEGHSHGEMHTNDNWEEWQNGNWSEEQELDWSDEEKDKKPYPLKRYGDYPQRSYEAYSRQYCGTDYPNWRNRILESYKPKLPYGCNPHDISWNLTDEQILNMPYEFLFWLSKRKAFILYFYYGIYLERKYYLMVDYMNKWFYDVAKANNLPDDYKLEWWEECNKDLLYDLELIQKTFANFFRNFVDKRRKKYLWIIPFENLIYRFYKITFRSISRNKDKWISILNQRVKSYRARANRKHITHGDKRWKLEKGGKGSVMEDGSTSSII